LKPEEVQAERYLKHRGHTKIDYEPDGNVAPDFLVDDLVAVEVRRLNQNYLADGKPRGLEVEAIPLWWQLKQLFIDSGPPIGGKSWFVWPTYRRPIEDWKTLKPKLRQALDSFRSNPHQPDEVIVGDHFELHFHPASKTHTSAFVLGGATDLDEGGFIVGELITNIQHCIAEKTCKVAPHQAKYPEWWLVLVNRIDHDLSEDDKDVIREHVTVPPIWKRVTVVSWRDHTRSFEL